MHDMQFHLQGLMGANWTPEALTALSTLVVGLVLLVTRLFMGSSFKGQKLQLPRLHRQRGWDYPTLLKEGAHRYPNSPYIITYNGYEYVVFPCSSFDEVKRLNACRASMIDWFNQIFWSGWTFMGTDNYARYLTIAIDLTRALPSRVWMRQDSARAAFEAVLGPKGTSKDWTTVSLWETVQKIVALMNATGLLGPELGTDPRWLKATQRLHKAMKIGLVGSHVTPRILRPLVAPVAFLPARLVDWHMSSLLRPTVQRELNAYEAKEARRGHGSSKETVSTATFSSRDDSEDGTGTGGERSIKAKFPLTEWLLKRYRSHDGRLSRLLRDYIVIAFEAAISSSGRLYFMLAELATRPELVKELREEVTRNTDQFGRLPLGYLTELRKMDSFLLESARAAASSRLTLFRRVRKPVKLSIGPELPPGTLICVDRYHLGKPQMRYEDVEDMDPLRSYKIRQQPGQEDMHQFTVPGHDNTIWGGGTQACPGRVFASITMKVVLAHLLTNYDIQLLPAGESRPMRKSMLNGSSLLDTKAKIMIRDRQTL